jgi:hypothetical protein
MVSICVVCNKKIPDVEKIFLKHCKNCYLMDTCIHSFHALSPFEFAKRLVKSKCPNLKNKKFKSINEIEE